MFLRCNRRKKDGKLHEYWSVVESRRLTDGRVVQRQVLYLGEINANQSEVWRKTIEVQEAGTRRQVALFPVGSMPADAVDAIGVRVSELRLQRPRQWGACWLALSLWQQLELDAFWAPRLPSSREGTPWLKVLKTLVAYRLIDPGSEWRLHRQWFDSSAMADLLDADFALAEKNTLYRCLDKLVAHKHDLFKFLLRRYIERLKALQGQSLTRDQLLMMLGAAKHDAGRAANLVKVSWPVAATTTASLEFRLDRAKLRQVRRREGRYLLRTNLQGNDPAQLWTFYLQLTEVEQAFKELKHDLSIRPIYHHDARRIEAHVFVAFLAYCLQVTLKARLRPAASGITPREVLSKFKTMQMVDIHLPTTDGRELVLSRYTQPEPDHRMLPDQLHLVLPDQPPPKITARQAGSASGTAPV